MSDPLEIRRRRLLYQSKRRGTKEADMVIGQFAMENLQKMTSEELDQFEALLQENDPDIMTWVSGTEDPPLKHQNMIFERICDFKNILLNH
ncbi:MAG: succinate dehydrogenase assembly factor 2 [Rhodospirillaceae bacterium]|nr:succinate dehydrogenase assembly factor 2 [Rhodospirillaceae bacterium]|tara:strand:- start:7853 stop:8125 length:273 start_codon:yes stop_codon:yes gene_type:complete